jgi:4'-phosphopantetheinyl transferase
MPDSHSPNPSSADIDLWLTYYDRIVDPALLAGLDELLNAAERAQQQRFYFADDRLRYLVTRAMVRTVLSRYASVAPADWTFTQNDYGRPLIGGGAAPGLCFNISHTRGLIALAVARGREVGVDVENVALRQPSIEIADHFFSAPEVAALGALPESMRQQRFFEYWTFKEAYIKARGMGLSLPLDRFSFDFPAARAVRLSVDDALGDDAGRWHFWQCRPTPDYLLALCGERLDGAPPALAVRTIIPTVAHESVDTIWLRSSAGALTRR